jgi:hypothetical protein
VRGLSAIVASAWALAGLGAEATPSVRVVDVRVGLHERFTRVVVETDAIGEYRIEREAPRLLAIHVQARAQPGRQPAPGPLLESVETRSGEDGSVVLLRLRTERIEIAEQRLRDPPRIVLDLSQPAQAPPAGEPAPEGSSAPARAPPPPDEPLVFKWLDDRGVTHYTADPDRVPLEYRGRLVPADDGTDAGSKAGSGPP